MQESPYDYHLNSFIDHLTHIKRFSAHTVKAYHNDLNQFFAYLAKHYNGIPLQEVNARIVRSWLARLMEDERMATTVKRKISTLKAFFKYQVKTKVLNDSPMHTVVAPRTAKRLPQYVEQKDTELLFKNVEFPEGVEGQMEELIMELFYNTGIRLSELINIRYADIDFGQKTLKVLGKGNKERLVPLGLHLLQKIERHQRLRQKEGRGDSKDYLLVTAKGKKLYPKYVYLLVKKYLSLVTTINKKSPHILRHTFATHLTNKGADINAVKELLGHSSLASTQVYTHNNIEKLKEVYKKAHPRA